jgi:DNA-binding SARP family transcriptional activator
MPISSQHPPTAAASIWLINPTSHLRAYLLAQALQTPQRSLYYSITAESTTLTAMLTGMVRETDPAGTLFPTLSVQLARAVSGAAGPEPAAAFGAALMGDLAAGPGGWPPLILCLDGFDLLTDDVRTVAAFVSGMMHSLQTLSPAECPVLAVSARALDVEPWFSAVTAGFAHIVDMDRPGTPPEDEESVFALPSMTAETDADAAGTARLSVYAFGRGRALANGREITHQDGTLPRNLFFFFIDRPLSVRTQIFETFWPELATKEATNVFHVTKRKITERISSVIGSGGLFELTQYVSGYYLPNPKVARYYDVDAFQKALATAATAEDRAGQIAAYTQAMRLYTGPFLEGANMPWIEIRRANLHAQWLDALTTLSGLHAADGQPEQALRWMLRAVRAAPAHEALQREVVRLYRVLGRPADARAHAERFAAAGAPDAFLRWAGSENLL